MTTQTASRSARSPRTAVALDPTLRAIRREVARWALAAGQPLNVDALTVILAARHAEALVEGRPFNRWTANSVLTFLFGTADDWCDRHGVARQPHLGESLLTYVNFLDASGVLSSGSSSLRQLRSTISDLSGLTPSGHRRDASTGGAVASPAPLRPIPTNCGGDCG
ncbi:MAG: hypothetical protein U0Q22_09830 [Acidimicrobiales bacterium]